MEPQAEIKKEATMEEIIAGWSEVDREWLTAHVPEVMRPIAVRHGRKIFQMVMMVGAANHAIQIIAAQGRGNRSIIKANFVLQNTLDALAKATLLSFDPAGKAFLECQQDIERMAALSDTGQRSENDKVSKGGIILNS